MLGKWFGRQILPSVAMAFSLLLASPSAHAQDRALTAVEQAAAEKVNAAVAAKDYVTARNLLTGPDLAQVASAQFILYQLMSQGAGGPKDEASAQGPLLRAAELGDPQAMMLIAENFANGKFGPRDDAKAVQFYQAAAAKQWPTARFELGKHYYKMQMFNSALVEFQRGGNFSHACLALMYTRGEGTTKDDVQARWYARSASRQQKPDHGCLTDAANAGNPVAAYWIAAQILDDRNKTPDPSMIAPAVAMLEKAAAQSHTRTNALLAKIYFNGKLVPRDATKAYKYASAAALDDDDAAYIAGVLLARGEGVALNSVNADKFLLRADMNEDAIYERALLYANGAGAMRNPSRAAELMGSAYNLDHPKAMPWLLAQAGNGDLDAMVELGDIYRYGTGASEKDLKAARSWYQTALDKGSVKAMGRMGDMLQVEGKYDAALAQWKRAAEKGDPHAMASYGDKLYTSRGLAGDAAGKQQGWNWMVAAAQAGDRNAMRRLVQFSFTNAAYDPAGRPAHLATAVQWSAEAFNLGEYGEAPTLARLFAESPPIAGVTDYARAVEMYKRYLRFTAEDNVMFKLADLYLSGNIAVDKPRAWLLYAMPNLMYYGKPPGNRADAVMKTMTSEEKQKAERLLRSCEANDWLNCF